MEPGGSQYSQMGKTRLYFLPRPARESRREAPRHYVILSEVEGSDINRVR